MSLKSSYIGLKFVIMGLKLSYIGLELGCMGLQFSYMVLKTVPKKMEHTFSNIATVLIYVQKSTAPFWKPQSHTFQTRYITFFYYKWFLSSRQKCKFWQATVLQNLNIFFLRHFLGSKIVYFFREIKFYREEISLGDNVTDSLP